MRSSFAAGVDPANRGASLSAMAKPLPSTAEQVPGESTVKVMRVVYAEALPTELSGEEE
jgi:hypothetical protein